MVDYNEDLKWTVATVRADPAGIMAELAAMRQALDLVNSLAKGIGARWDGGEWTLPFFVHGEPDKYLRLPQWLEERRAAAESISG